MKEGNKMKFAGVLLPSLALLLVVGCGSGLTMNHDFDQQADFSQFRSFQWVPAKDSPNQLVESRIEAAVISELTRKKGLVQLTDNPDLYVIYHIGAKDKVDIQSYGYGYGAGAGRYRGAYGGYGGGGISSYNYTEGTLIIDMISAETKQLVWRGSATGVLEENPSPDKLTKNVNTAVAAILAQYPPK
jgi:hypothetical protein